MHADARAETLDELYPERAEQAWRERQAASTQRYMHVVSLPWSGDGTPYGLAAMRGIMGDLAREAPEGRNNALTRAAFRLGRFVGGEELRHETTVTALRDAGRELHLPAHEVKHIIDGAYRRGILNPKSAPPRKAAA